MKCDGWSIPDELQALIAIGRWPRDKNQQCAQHSRPLVPLDRVQAFAPEEYGIYLLAPPFRTVREEVAESERHFWKSPLAAPDEISFEHSIIIADFGFGSDAPILFDYRLDPLCPSVLRLRWSEKRWDGEG